MPQDDERGWTLSRSARRPFPGPDRPLRAGLTGTRPTRRGDARGPPVCAPARLGAPWRSPVRLHPSDGPTPRACRKRPRRACEPRRLGDRSRHVEHGRRHSRPPPEHAHPRLIITSFSTRFGCFKHAPTVNELTDSRRSGPDRQHQNPPWATPSKWPVAGTPRFWAMLRRAGWARAVPAGTRVSRPSLKRTRDGHMSLRGTSQARPQRPSLRCGQLRTRHI